MTDKNLDEELRAAVFARVQQLRMRYAGRIPRNELTAGVQFHGERIPIWNPYRGIHKPAILGRSGAALSIQTSIESPYDDAHDPEGDHFIYKYQGNEPTNRDNVALRAAKEEQRPLVYFMAVDPGIYEAILPVYVTGEDPTSLQFILVADQLSAGTGIAAAAMAGPRREYETRAVLQRLHQQYFRRIVLKAYREHCAICRLGHVNLLDAAHILGDRHPKGEPVVTNGIGLCKIHHSAFDSNILGIDSNARVYIRSDILAEVDGPMLKHGLQEVHGTALVLPTRLKDRPNPDFLEERFAEFKAA